jgi:hypothetical protein
MDSVFWQPDVSCLNWKAMKPKGWEVQIKPPLQVSWLASFQASQLSSLFSLLLTKINLKKHQEIG